MLKFILMIDIVHTGCKLNWFFAYQLKNFLEKENVNNVVIFTPCSVTSQAERKSRKLYRRILKKYPNFIIIVAGCFPAEKLDFFNNKNTIIFEQNFYDKEKFYKLKNLIIKKQKNSSLTNNNHINSQKSYKNFLRFPLIIQKGCVHNCSYCLIRKMRGNNKIFDRDTIIKEAVNLKNKGTQEIIITGTNLLLWNKNLIKLIEDIKSIGFWRVTFSSLEASNQLFNIENDIITLIKNNILTKHLHISIQHFSKKVLESMNRSWQNVNKLLKFLENLRNTFKDIFLSADIMVGFPTEAEEDFKLLVNILEKGLLNDFHVFSYSPRPNTDAFKLKDLNPKIKKERANILINIKHNLLNTFRKNLIGNTYSALKIDDKTYITENYITCKTDKNANLIKNVKLVRLINDKFNRSMEAKIID